MDAPGWTTAPADAPEALRAVPGHCGPVSAWMALAHFSLTPPASPIIRACRHTRTYGTFMIALAVGLHELGLRTAFFTDPDADPKPIERRCYRLARERGLPVHPALDVHPALARIDAGHVGLVCYGTPEGEGHISPLTGRQGTAVLLPNTAAGRMEIAAFEQRWREPGILRQLVLVSEETG